MTVHLIGAGAYERVDDPAEVAKLREKVKPVIDKYSASVGESTVKELMAEIAKVRK